MTNKKIRINTLILQVLKRESFDNFSISDFKDAYLEISGNKTHIQARKYIYKQILRLMNYGVLIKSGNKYSHNARYRKVYSFNDVIFIKEDAKKALASKPIISNSEKLNKTLHDYNVDMISAIGESEEYIKLLHIFPEMQKELREKYTLSNNKSLKLQGKIKAINAVMEIQKGI